MASRKPEYGRSMTSLCSGADMRWSRSQGCSVEAGATENGLVGRGKENGGELLDGCVGGPYNNMKGTVEMEWAQIDCSKSRNKKNTSGGAICGTENINTMPV